jgi:hypothetical protein
MVRSGPPSVQNTLDDRAKAAALQPFEVLASFQIERTGQQVRIVDADGSAYEGQVVEPEVLGGSQAANQAAGNAFALPGPANVAQQNASAGNFQAQGNAYAVQSNADGLPPKAANNEAAQNQAQSPGAEALLNLAALQQAGVGSGFAFQASGVNRKLNQSVTITGSCIAVPLPMGGPGLNGVNLSNQSQAPAGADATLRNMQTPQQQAPASQSQNNFDNSNVNYRNNQAALNTQNAAPAGQFWRVTGQVQVGPTNRFVLDAAAILP